MISETRSSDHMMPVRYSEYIAFLTRIYLYVQNYYSDIAREQPTSEAESVALYAQKFLATIKALALKSRYSPEYLRLPAVKLTGSGFPYYYDIMQLEADLSSRKERLPSIGDIDDLKLVLLDHLMKEPPQGGEGKYEEFMISCLWQISERAYLESLDLRQQFFQFTPGKLLPFKSEDKKDGRRSYIFSWGCYDTESNRPCVYIMVLAQDSSENPLDAPENPEYIKFLETVRHIAARAPENLKSIGVRLDESFSSTLYPKMLKRICFGPVISPHLYKGAEVQDQSSLAGRLMPVFERAELSDDEFALFFTTEYVVSEREEQISKIFGKPKARQIFHVPSYDHNLMRRGVTAAVSHVMLPHRLLQELSKEDFSNIPELTGAEHIIYNQEGDVINVG